MNQPLYKRKRFITCLLVALFCLSTITAQAALNGDFPTTDESGFPSKGEFVYENPQEGIWRYLSPSLRIEIIRHNDLERKIIYTVADIRTLEGERFTLTPKDPQRRMERMDYIPIIAQENGVIFATTSDFAHLRIRQKRRVGILIRDGEILSELTYRKRMNKLPNLDILALFANGDMHAYDFNAYTAQEYLDMGATDVLAFGPILIQDGIINEAVLRKLGLYREPRVAIGMVERGHYISIMVESRHENSRGMNTIELAEVFLEHGCHMAFNLDGGQSAVMVFMGQQITRVGKTKNVKANARSTAEIFGIGHSPLVREPLSNIEESPK